eukprot:4365072-Pleurochrysis_carterae.AAC.1
MNTRQPNCLRPKGVPDERAVTSPLGISSQNLRAVQILGTEIHLGESTATAPGQERGAAVAMGALGPSRVHGLRNRKSVLTCRTTDLFHGSEMSAGRDVRDAVI